MAAKKVLLGYEIGSGKPVHIPVHHLVATGTTQLSGKTTTLEALITRLGMKAVAFRTKRGESAFAASQTHFHAPYYREPTSMPYWQYIQSLLEATMGERMKFERSWIITITKGARTPRDVLEAVNRELERLAAAREKRHREAGLTESVYTNIKAYLEIVVPAIEGASFTRDLTLHAGVTVMDLVGLRDEVQAIAVAATLETLYERESDCIVVIPEAWKFVPEGRGTPVKRVLEKVIREGAAIGLHVWFDSQDLAGVDKRPLKNVDGWVLGRQREINEVEHTIAQVPLPRASKPKPEEIMTLGVGQFIACYGDQVHKVYVRPVWLPEDVAVRIAKGAPVSAADRYRPTHSGEETEMNDQEREKYERELKARDSEVERLKQQVEELTRDFNAERYGQATRPEPAPPPPKAIRAMPDKQHEVIEGLSKRVLAAEKKNEQLELEIEKFRDGRNRPTGSQLAKVTGPDPPAPLASDIDAFKLAEPVDVRNTAVRTELGFQVDPEYVGVLRDALLKDPVFRSVIGKGGVVEVPAKRVILSAFLEEHVARIKAPVVKLPDRAKQFLAFLSTKEAWVSAKQTAIALFGYASDYLTVVKAVAATGAIEYDSQHGKARYVLPDMLKKDLQGTYEISDEELAQIHVALQHEFLAFLKSEG